MTTEHITLNGRIEPDGRLRLDVPTHLPGGDAQIILTIKSNSPRSSAAPQLSDLAGKLQWRGDAVSQQRRLRDEWR
jgi:hypothetical protein